MKKPIVLITMLLLSYIAKAQFDGFYVGLNAALQNTWILNSNDFNENDRLEFETTFKQAYGLDLGFKFNPKIGIQSGIIYSQQGQKYGTKGNVNAQYKTELSYFKFPILFVYQMGSLKNLSFITQAGFQFSLLSEAKSSRMKIFDFYSPAFVDVKDFYAPVTIDLVLGVGLQYAFNKFSINAMIRPDYSLTDIEKTNKKPGLRSPASNFTLGMPQLGFQYFFN